MSYRLSYLAPAAEPLAVLSEGIICESGLGEPGASGPDWTDPGLTNDYFENIL